MKILIAGCGGQGSSAGGHLVKEKDVERIVCADADISRARRLADRLKQLNKGIEISTEQVDFSRPEDLAKAAKGVNAVFNACFPKVNAPILKACIDVSAHYVDVASLPFVPDGTPSSVGPGERGVAMKVVCAWCGKDMGEKPPYNDRTTTPSICVKCLKKELKSACRVVSPPEFRARLRDCLEEHVLVGPKVTFVTKVDEGDFSQEKSVQWRCRQCNVYFEFGPPGDNSKALVECPSCQYEYMTYRRTDGVLFCLPKHIYVERPNVKIPSTFLSATVEDA